MTPQKSNLASCFNFFFVCTSMYTNHTHTDGSSVPAWSPYLALFASAPTPCWKIQQHVAALSLLLLRCVGLALPLHVHAAAVPEDGRCVMCVLLVACWQRSQKGKRHRSARCLRCKSDQNYHASCAGSTCCRRRFSCTFILVLCVCFLPFFPWYERVARSRGLSSV